MTIATTATTATVTTTTFSKTIQTFKGTMGSKPPRENSTVSFPSNFSCMTPSSPTEPTPTLLCTLIVGQQRLSDAPSDAPGGPFNTAQGCFFGWFCMLCYSYWPVFYRKNATLRKLVGKKAPKFKMQPSSSGFGDKMTCLFFSGSKYLQQKNVLWMGREWKFTPQLLFDSFRIETIWPTLAP